MKLPKIRLSTAECCLVQHVIYAQWAAEELAHAQNMPMDADIHLYEARRHATNARRELNGWALRQKSN